jgi:hypothetical protein
MRPQEPGDLGFLAAHDVGDVAVGGEADAGDDPHLQAVGSADHGRMAVERFDSDRAVGIGRLAPAVLAADHAASEQRRARMRLQPVADEPSQRLLELGAPPARREAPSSLVRSARTLPMASMRNARSDVLPQSSAIRRRRRPPSDQDGDRAACHAATNDWARAAVSPAG